MKRILEWLRVGEPIPRWAQLATLGVAFLVFGFGLWWQSAGLLGVGAVVLCVQLQTCWVGARSRRHHANDVRIEPRHRRKPVTETAEGSQPERWRAHPEYADLPSSADALVNEMLSTGRYALLLRPEMSRHLDRDH